MEQQLKASKRSVSASAPASGGSASGGKKAAPSPSIQNAPPTPQAAGAQNGKHTQADASVRVGNVYQPECPAQRALEAIASKWAILILHSLLESPLRFNALQRKLPGISQKVLTEQLRRLERFGIIARTVHPTVPPSVEYSLTSPGRELKGALGSLCEWSNKHAAILLAGEVSDAAARGSAKAKAARTPATSGSDAGRSPNTR